jgi:predicted nucleic acid-binding protein
MTINYTVKAQVIDIMTDAPKAEDVFLVDTNVWFWMTYPTAGQTAHPYQLNTYPSYVSNALGIGAKIYKTGLSLAELGHRIERTEHDIYRSFVNAIGLKEYRHNLPSERSRIVSEVEAAWAQVKSMAEPLDVVVDNPSTDAALSRFKTEKVDGYDLFILESMKNHGVVQLITDDGDFTTVSGIQVFTANRNVIIAARSQGRLLRR